MLILKQNVLSVEDLFTIERQLLRWLDNKETNVGFDFNVLSLGRADIYGHLLGVFTRLGCVEILDITHSDLLDFLIDVDAAYLNAPYHSFYHAVDIVLMTYFMLTDLEAKYYIPALDIAALLIAALCHDIGHPGYNNVYQVNFNTDLAKKYNNTSVLEALSAEMTRHLIMKKHIHLTHQLTEDQRNNWINKIEMLILHTDMVHHYVLQEQAGLLEDMMYTSCLEHPCTMNCESTIANANPAKNDGDNKDDHCYFSQLNQRPPAFSSMTHQWLNCVEEDFISSPQCYYPTITDDDHHTVTSTSSTLGSHSTCRDRMGKTTLSDQQCHQLSSILLHAADISNTVRPWAISKQWSDLIVQEFFRQGDLEKRHGTAVSPGMDRDLSTQPDISLTFGDLVVKPYFQVVANLLPGAHIFLEALDHNRTEWVRIKQELGDDHGNRINSGDHIVNEKHQDNLVDLLQYNDHPTFVQQRQFPTGLLPIPESALQPHIERRVSVAAGTLVIPENINYLIGNNDNSANSDRTRCRRPGLRSYSFMVEGTSLSRKPSHGPLLQQRSITLPSKAGLVSDIQVF